MTRPYKKRIHPKYATAPILAKWCIWSVVNQSWLAGQIRIYIWGAVAVVAVFTLTGLIPLKAALSSIFFSGMTLTVTLWLLIRQRRIWLLHIREPALRQQALDAMVNYLNEINYPLPWDLHGPTIQDSDPNEEADYSHSR